MPARWFRQEDGWAILIGLGFVLMASLLFLLGEHGVLASVTVHFAAWDSPVELLALIGPQLPSLIYLHALLLIPLSIGATRIGYSALAFGKGFLLLFLLSVVVSVLASNRYLKGPSWKPL